MLFYQEHITLQTQSLMREDPPRAPGPPLSCRRSRHLKSGPAAGRRLTDSGSVSGFFRE